LMPLADDAAGHPVVLLTDPIDPGAAARLAAAADVRALGDDDILAAVADASVVVVRRRIPQAIFEAAPRLRALVRHGAGLDFVPVEAASEHGVAVVNTPRVNAISVAEAAFGLILAGSRRIALKDRRIRQGAWDELRGSAFAERELRGRPLGIVGFGAIGEAIARIAHFGFGMRVMASRRTAGRSSGVPPHVAVLPLAELLASAEILVVACPLTPETEGLIGAREIAAMPAGAAIVNIARGPIVCERALADALDSGQLSFAGLDVLGRQPPASDSRLLASDRTVLSPHTAGITAEAIERMSAVAVDETLRILRGERPHNLVNADVWSKIEQRWRSAPLQPG
jgi:D-3-phosphoglycerate dehydrogenase / 2-oxoglutarate reductase